MRAVREQDLRRTRTGAKMKDFRKFMRDNIVVFDGAFGTALQRRYPGAGTLPEKLNLTRPDIIARIHREYAEAGADVISAATFGANAAKAGDISDDLIRAAIKIARSAAENRFVALDLGPTGQLIEPLGTMSFDTAYDIYKRAVLAADGADLVLVETMSDLAELRAALLAVKKTPIFR